MKYYLIKTNGDPIRVEYAYWSDKIDIVELTKEELEVICYTCESESRAEEVEKIRKVLEKCSTKQSKN